MVDFRKACFVIMPFGKKKVGTGWKARTVDFDPIYDDLFVPAIKKVRLPDQEGGGFLEPVRTDREFYAGAIGQEMFELIEYSRFVVADISSTNANVFYELGARHRAREAGTAIFRQPTAPIPFDINQIKAFPYQIKPSQALEESRDFVTKVLENSLVMNKWDSPIMLALRKQHEGPQEVQDVLLEAENALRAGDLEKAHDCWIQAAKLDPENPIHELKASAYTKSKGDWDTTVQLLHSSLGKESAIGASGGESSYAEAHRELGIATNKKDAEIFPRAGEESLRRAVHHNPEDYDAWASLGGVLRRAGDDAGAVDAYEKAVEASNGHPYPLLMAIKLRAKVSGAWSAFDNDTAMMVGSAKGFRTAQVDNEPPIDVPWSYFDLAEIEMYLGNDDAALELAKKGMAECTASWMPKTFKSALLNFPETPELGARNALIALAEQREAELP